LGAARSLCRGKIFSSSPAALQVLADILEEAFHPFCAVSRPLQTDQGDFHIIVTVYDIPRRAIRPVKETE